MKYGNMEFNKNIPYINYSPKNPFSEVEYRPELDTSADCIEYKVELFQILIGLLC